jgi:hypothetical protein
MGVTKHEGVQAPSYKEAEFTFEDLVSAGFVPAIDLPSDAEVIDGAMVITEAFDSETSDTGTVGDAETANRYKAGIDMTALGTSKIAATGVLCNDSNRRQFGFSWTGVGEPPTEGKGKLWCLYIQKSRADFVQR